MSQGAAKTDFDAGKLSFTSGVTNAGLKLALKHGIKKYADADIPTLKKIDLFEKHVGVSGLDMGSTLYMLHRFQKVSECHTVLPANLGMTECHFVIDGTMLIGGIEIDSSSLAE